MIKFYKPLVRIACVLIFVITGYDGFATTYPVTNTNNSGPGSLAQAITDANANAGKDIITFALPAGQPCIIALTSPLPDITGALIIDGYSQSGAFPGTMSGRIIRININGAGIGAGKSIFVIATSDVEISGLAIYNAPNYGITTSGFLHNTFYIWGNYVGTDSTGLTTSLGNSAGGIDLNNGNSGNAINHVIIGTNGDGVNDANEGNLISCNKATATSGDGILLWSVEDSRISGNYIGLNKNGNSGSFGNGRYGILLTVRCTRDTVGTNGDAISDNLEANYIASNTKSGIQLGFSDANAIAGNSVGLTTSKAAAGNSAHGIELINSSNNRIGTNADGVSDNLEANMVGSNAQNGIVVSVGEFFTYNGNSTGNIIAGNAIGTDTAGLVALSNTGNGIYLSSNTPTTGTITDLFVTNTRIGSDNSGVRDNIKRNIIANNNIDGILLEHLNATSGISGTKISQDSIYNNKELGIELRNFGAAALQVTPNDQGDVDAGPNGLLNFPIVTSAKVDGTTLSVAGFSGPSTVLEFYIADGGTHPATPPGGYTKNFGSGKTFLFRAQQGTTLNGILDDSTGKTGTYTGADQGNGAGVTITESKFGFIRPLSSLPATVTTTTPITAVAIDASGNTSMFAPTQFTILPVHFISFKGRVNSGKSYLTWTTAQESNNSHFDIERSANGVAYSTIGTVAAQAEIYNEYNFTDNAPLAAVNYYRLKQADRDGRFTYSPVLILRTELGASVTARATPNPFTDAINLSYRLTKGETVHVRLFDQMGRILRNYSIKGSTGLNTYNISDLKSLPSGFYTLELKGEHLSFIQQMVK